MKKRSLIMLLVLLFMLSFTSMVAAHSHVKSTVPGDGETVEEPVETPSGSSLMPASNRQPPLRSLMKREMRYPSLKKRLIFPPMRPFGTAIKKRNLMWWKFGPHLGRMAVRQGTSTFSVAASVETELEEATEEPVKGESSGEENEQLKSLSLQEEELPEQSQQKAPEENREQCHYLDCDHRGGAVGRILFFLLRK